MHCSLAHVMGHSPMADALDHLRVLDLTSGSQQPCARVFADFGAEVIKIEPLEGDPGRQQGPFFGGERGSDRSLVFTYLNRGKQSITLDLGSEADRQRLRALAGRADVLVEDCQPGELVRL